MRYTISGIDLSSPLFCRVRNTELSAMRAAYLNGPYSLYVDMRPADYNEFTKVEKGAEPVYDYHLKPGQHFSFELPVLHQRQSWIVTVQSEILFSRSAEINFELTIGDTHSAAKYHGSNAKKHFKFDSSVEVIKQDTSAIWQTPFPKPEEPLHVCVLTHGLVSNVTADLLYMKEIIDNAAVLTGENLVCKGYTGNVCRTGRGIKYLGQRLAYWIMDELIPTYKPKKLSFLAHSLGGPTQTYALGFIQATNPGILDGIELVNFISFASPFLGISAENPGYVQFALDFGVVGKSGRDLGLSWTPGTEKPLLERLPNEQTLTILRKFKNRTIYANAVHDGIVPLRTSALVFLDWYAIAGANNAYKSGRKNRIHYRQSHNDKTSMQSALEARDEFKKEQEQEQEQQQLQQRREMEKRNTDSSTSQSKFRSQSLHRSTENGRDAEYMPEVTESDSSSSDSTEGSNGVNHSNESSTTRPAPKPLQQRHSTDEDNPTDSLSSFLFERKQAKIFSRYQTVNDETAANSVGETLPHKTSLIENGIFILLPPHPNNNFITDPESRQNVILHDRVYSEKDLPPKKYKKSIIGNLSGHKDGMVEIAKREEKIARSYHHNLSWRKVIVSLLPEAHNNIVVRRRFSNAYGWPVVHHCVNEHFLNYKKKEDEIDLGATSENKNNNKKDIDFEQRIISDQSYDLSDPVAAMRLYDGVSTPQSPQSPDSPSTVQSTSSSIAQVNPPWSESEDDIETGPDTDHDPQRASMLKVIRN